MTLYRQMTKYALHSPYGDAESAWEWAKQEAAAQGLGTPSTRNKGCPKAAFVGLCSLGHVYGMSGKSGGNENAEHVKAAYSLLASDPTYQQNKNRWWKAVAQKRKISRQGQNGVLEVLLELIAAQRFNKQSGSAKGLSS